MLVRDLKAFQAFADACDIGRHTPPLYQLLAELNHGIAKASEEEKHRQAHVNHGR